MQSRVGDSEFNVQPDTISVISDEQVRGNVGQLPTNCVSGRASYIYFALPIFRNCKLILMKII